MTPEQRIQDPQWIFRYIRADRQEIDMGPYTTEDEARKARDNMAGLGALCTPPIRVAKDYQLYRGEEDKEPANNPEQRSLFSKQDQRTLAQLLVHGLCVYSNNCADPPNFAPWDR